MNNAARKAADLVNNKDFSKLAVGPSWAAICSEDVVNLSDQISLC